MIAILYLKAMFLPWQAARKVARECPGVDVRVFSDRDIAAKRGEVEAALRDADVFFGSLLFDYDQVFGFFASCVFTCDPRRSPA